MIDVRLALFSLIGIIMGSILFIYGFIWLKQKRIIQDLPTSKIRSMALGLVEVKGKVQPFEKELLKSPFTNQDCVYYKYIIEKKVKSKKYSTWITLKTEKGMQNFYLADETGKVLVNPQGASFDLKTKNFCYSSFLKEPPSNIKNFLKENNIRYKDFFGINYNMRYKEYYIQPNESLYIIGTAVDNPYIKEATAIKNEQDLMIAKGSYYKKFYLISDKPEKKLIKNLKLKSISSIIFGAGLIILFIGTFLKSINFI